MSKEQLYQEQQEGIIRNEIKVDKKLAGWKIWYDDGTTFSHKNGTWEEAPIDGVQIVVEHYTDGDYQIHTGGDYYFMREDTIMNCNPLHIERHLRKYCPWLKFGRWTRKDLIDQAYKEAKDSNLNK